MSLITLSGVSKYFGAELVLESISFRVERGDRLALVGSNGSGKSTILRIIAGLEEPDAGSVSRARGLQVAYLPQEPDFHDTHTLYEAMLEGFRDVIQAQERLKVLEAAMASGSAGQDVVDEYGRLQALVEHAGYDYRERIERVLTGLELEPDTWQTQVEDLSGGQRTRANLARILLKDADVLLLDEPTNHLDIGAVEWLEGYLRDLKRAYVIVAHDRYLLDRVSRRTVELSAHRVEVYDAPYSRFLELKAERVERQRLEYEAQQEHIAKTEEYIRRYGAGQRSKEARGRQKRLNRLERIERPQEDQTVRLKLNRAERTGDVALVTERLVAGYPDRPLVRMSDEVVVRRGERIALIGPNGSGKTTLLRTLLGQIPPLEGTVRWGARTNVGYYSQTLGLLDERRTILEEVRRVKSMTEEEARSFMGRFLFSEDDVFKTIGVLSGGERSRVALARLILEAPNVLVLDEPTNHLDIASRDALEDVLADFGGTLIFVSHDRFLIDSLSEELWSLQDGRIVRYLGSYSDFAAGSAQPLDRQVPERRAHRNLDGSPETQVRQLEAEAESLATRLAEVGPTTSVTQLDDLTEQYAEVQGLLEEAQRAWLRSVRAKLRESLA